jgi:hypothetical protein
VHAQSNGYTVDSTGAKAYGFGFGARYKFDYDWTGGVQISDVNTKLDVNESITDNLGTRNRQFKSAFPRRVTVEIAKRISSNWIAAVQHDKFQGAYGGSMLDIQMIRAGTEYQSGAWRYRAGALIPLRIYSDQSESVKLPLPFAPTMGLGWVNRDLDLSLAVSSHPVMSVHKNNAAPTVDLSVTYHF